MGTVTGFHAAITRNKTPVNFKQASVEFTAGRLGSQWQVQLTEPLIPTSGDLWTINLGFAGFSWDLIVNALAEQAQESDTVPASTSTISSTSLDLNENMDVLNQYAIPKTFVFINPTWLQQLNAAAYIDQTTGIVMLKSGNSGSSAVNSTGTRFFDPRLPGKDHDVYPDGTYDFQCFYASSHYDIAQKLCSMIGVRLQVNTPQVPLVDTCTFQSGTKWFDCIKKNFLMWSPYIDIDLQQSKAYPNGIATVIIEDVLSGSSGLADNLHTVALDNDAIVSVNRKLSRPSDDRLVEHVIIIGRKTQNTTANFGERPDYTPIEIPAVELPETMRIQSGAQQVDMSKYKVMGDYTGSFGTGPDEWRVTPIIFTEHWLSFHEYKIGGQYRRIPVGDEVLGYDENGLVSKVVTKHWYSQDKQKVVKSQESHYFYTNKPGQKNKELQLLRVKTTLQNYVVKPLNLTLTKELIEDVVIYSSSVVTVDGQPTAVKDDPKPLIEALRANPNYVDTTPNTQQDLMEMTTYDKFTYIDRCDQKVLLKTEVAINWLAKNLPQVNSQVLDNPLKQNVDTQSKEGVFRREYKDPKSRGFFINGRGPYFHAAKTIQNDDICTDAIAYALAQRVWFRKNLALSPTLWDYDIQLALPVPLSYFGTMVSIPSLTRKINGNWVSIPGGSYYLKKVKYDVSSGQREIKFNQTITVGSQI